MEAIAGDLAEDPCSKKTGINTLSKCPTTGHLALPKILSAPIRIGLVAYVL